MSTNIAESQRPHVAMDQNNSIKLNFKQFEVSKSYHEGLETDKKSCEGGDRCDEELECPQLRKVDKFCQAKCLFLPARYTIALMAFIGNMIVFSMRTRFVFMNWNVTIESQVENQVDSAFFWAYMLAQVPGGFIAWKFAPTKIFGLSIVSSTVLNLLMPLADGRVLVWIQALQGLIEGVSLTACYGIWRYWAPLMERSRLATLAICGTYAGSAIGLKLSDLIAFYIGLREQFFVYGIFGIIWYIFWLRLCFDDPHKHPRISKLELKYIEQSLGETTTQLRVAPLTITVLSKMMRSMPVYAVIVVNFCRSWTFYMLVLYQTTFFRHNFAFVLEEEGFFGMLPHLRMMFIVPFGGMLVDHLRKNSSVSPTNVRKVFTCGGLIIQGLFFLFVPFAHTTTAAMVALVCGTSFSGFAISGYYANHLDIAPRYASILMGITSGIGALAGVIVAFILDPVIQANPTGCWTIVFIIAACVHLFGAVFYAIFASGELQSWAKPSCRAPPKQPNTKHNDA